MRKMQNTVTLYGYVYDSDLSLKQVKNTNSPNFGKDFIQGTLYIAVDDEFLNVIPVYYSYVTPTTKAGRENRTFTVLSKFLDYKDVEPENFVKVKVDTAIALNDFYVKENEEYTLVSTPRCEGGFITEITHLPDNNRNNFTVDAFISSYKVHEADEKKETPRYGELRGCIFNFRNDILPMSFTINTPAGIDFFEEAEISSSNPLCTSIWGEVNNKTIKIKRIEESAFGEPRVTYSEFARKEWLVTGTKSIPYDFGDEKVLTMEDMQKGMQNREIYLADIKRKREEYDTQVATENNAFSNFVPKEDKTTVFDF